MVWVNSFCLPVAELSLWLGTKNCWPKILRTKQDSSKLTHLTYTRIHSHTLPNINGSRRYDPESLKADFKTDSPPYDTTQNPTTYTHAFKSLESTNWWSVSWWSCLLNDISSCIVYVYNHFYNIHDVLELLCWTLTWSLKHVLVCGVLRCLWCCYFIMALLFRSRSQICV